MKGEFMIKPIAIIKMYLIGELGKGVTVDIKEHEEYYSIKIKFLGYKDMNYIMLINQPLNEDYIYDRLKVIINAVYHEKYKNRCNEITLFQTASIMANSDDYVIRFKAEVIQLTIRRDKLYKMVYEYDNGLLTFVPKCSIKLLQQQLDAMNKYLDILLQRAEIEGINI